MITALYASILAGLMVWLAFKVIKQRRSNQIAYADGGVDALIIARSAHGNSVDYIPITLILMAFVEYNGASAWMIHLSGIAFVVGRVLHAKSILANKLKGRKQGMIITFFTIFGLIALNLIYLPFDKLW